MNRRGFILPMLLLSAGAAGLLTMVIITAAAQRSQHARLHQARVQGREWCLGMHGLTAPVNLDIGAWKLSMDAQHLARAQGPRGTYTINATGQETWSPAP